MTELGLPKCSICGQSDWDLSPDWNGEIHEACQVLEDRIVASWREATRCWNEYRSADPRNKELRTILLSGAEEAQRYWSKLMAEKERRTR